ncbi:NYN domain-containing protein [Roseateles sp.]|uniref:NYN domain-containing protein n=1 Tax=Roseateles sp. TaxID=1971397 RepID=UPI0039E7B95C
MNDNKKVAFLVDFDNVATDVIEQALNAVFKDYGAAHIRRAYCNAEQALREQSFLKRLGLRAIVNLAIGKNSTDIALAADAMDLAIAEKPDVIVLVSSDSDFAPLVLRLREKGAWLRGFGQYGKTGDGVIQIYDQFNELAHDSGRSSAKSVPKPAAKRAPARKATAAKPAVKKGEPPKSAAPAPTPAPKPAAPAAAPVSSPVAAPMPAAKAAAPAQVAKAAPAAPTVKAAPHPVDANVAAAKEINAVLNLLPKLADGQWHDLGAAAKVLKAAGLLAKNAPSTRLFRKHPQAFQLQPEKNPNQVRFGHG